MTWRSLPSCGQRLPVGADHLVVAWIAGRVLVPWCETGELIIACYPRMSMIQVPNSRVISVPPDFGAPTLLLSNSSLFSSSLNSPLTAFNSRGLFGHQPTDSSCLTSSVDGAEPL